MLVYRLQLKATSTKVQKIPEAYLYNEHCFLLTASRNMAEGEAKIRWRKVSENKDGDVDHVSFCEVNIKSSSGAFRTIRGKWLLSITFHFSVGDTKETAALLREAVFQITFREDALLWLNNFCRWRKNWRPCWNMCERCIGMLSKSQHLKPIQQANVTYCASFLKILKSGGESSRFVD